MTPIRPKNSFLFPSKGFPNIWTVPFVIMDVGIPEKAIPFVFDRLYKVDDARSSKGSGLGLAIVRELVLIQGGNIFVEPRFTFFYMKIHTFHCGSIPIIFRQPFRLNDKILHHTIPFFVGSGLGLAIVRELVLIQGGNIFVEPRKKGSCFVMEFPILEN